MKKYHSDSKSYNAIVEAMQQIRQNALAEEYGEDEMEEAYMYEEDDEEEMAEMSGEEEEAVAEMMDEALYEMDMEDDEDNLNEADDGSRKARRRKRMRQALLIGAGLAAAGGLGAGVGAAYQKGRAMNPASDIRRQSGYASGLGGIIQDIQTGGSAMAQDAAMAAGNAAKTAKQAGIRSYYQNPTLGKLRGYKGTASGR